MEVSLTGNWQVTWGILQRQGEVGRINYQVEQEIERDNIGLCTKFLLCYWRSREIVWGCRRRYENAKHNLHLCSVVRDFSANISKKKFFETVLVNFKIGTRNNTEKTNIRKEWAQLWIFERERRKCKEKMDIERSMKGIPLLTEGLITVSVTVLHVLKSNACLLLRCEIFI